MRVILPVVMCDVPWRGRTEARLISEMLVQGADRFQAGQKRFA